MILARGPDARAAPVCGPAEARTLVKGADARVYASGARAFACHRAGRRARPLGARNRIVGAWVAGHRAAILRRSDTLTVYDLAGRASTQRVNVAGRVDALRLSRGGVAVFVATPDNGTPFIGASRGGLQIAAPGVAGDSLAFKNGVVAWRAQGGIHVWGLFAGTGPERRLARIGDVELGVRGSPLGGRLFLRRDGGARQWLGRVRSECTSSQGCAGVDLVQISGSFGASRTISTGPDRNDLWITVFDLAAGTGREACRWLLPNPVQRGSFQLAPDGSVTCARG